MLVIEKIKTKEDMANETSLSEKELMQYEKFYINDHNKI